MSIDTLIKQVGEWAEARNITMEGGSSPLAQLSKTLEECGELLAALNAKSTYHPVREGHDLDAMLDAYQDIDKEIVDAYGDILVTLIIGMQLQGTTVEYCLSKAWEEIKDRKGRMEHGVFVKEKSGE